MGLKRYEGPYEALAARIPNKAAIALTEQICVMVDLDGQSRRSLALFIDAANRLADAHVCPLEQRRRARDEFVEARRQLAADMNVPAEIAAAFTLRTVR